MNEYLSSTEVKDLVRKAQRGDDNAWDALYDNFRSYVHNRAWKRLHKINMPQDRKADLEQELYQAGWMGFLYSMRSYDPARGEFLTYATHYIDGEITKEVSYQWNFMGMTEYDGENLRGGPLADHPFLGAGISVAGAPDRGEYPATRRVLQIIEILRLLTDEDYSLTKKELYKLLTLYRVAKHQNGTKLEDDRKIRATIDDMLLELDPLTYTEENEKDYRILYEGYKEDRLKAKLHKEKGQRAPVITGFSYAHLFSKQDLDRIIQIICFSDMLSLEDKKRIVERLVSTASVYYRTPFLMEMGQGKKKLWFHPKGVHGRFSGRILKDRANMAGNIQVIQQAINHAWQIRFRFNCYTAGHEMVPKSDYMHILSPYHLVAYHEHYYCIGMKEDDRRIWHYRVDLMSDVEIRTDEAGNQIRIQLCEFDGLPISNAFWDPEKYMAMHLYMGYDEPRDIRIKLRADDYTILHDWFGDYYEKVEELEVAEEDGTIARYDIAVVKTSPSMVVHWAMQYAGAVEILDEDIRDRIREEIRILQKKYGMAQ